MLVFTRQAEEEIVIGDEVRVKVLEISGGSVKIGIIAPRRISVHRAEIYEQIVQQNLAAAQTARAPRRLRTYKQSANTSTLLLRSKALLPIDKPDAEESVNRLGGKEERGGSSKPDAS